MPHSLFPFSVVAMHNTPLRYLPLRTAKAKEKERKKEKKKANLKIKDGGKKQKSWNHPTENIFHRL